MHRAGDNIHVGVCNMHGFETFYMRVSFMHYECPHSTALCQELVSHGFILLTYIRLHVHNMFQTWILLKPTLLTCMTTCILPACYIHAGDMHAVWTFKLHACVMHVAYEHVFRLQYHACNMHIITQREVTSIVQSHLSLNMTKELRPWHLNSSVCLRSVIHDALWARIYLRIYLSKLSCCLDFHDTEACNVNIGETALFTKAVIFVGHFVNS